MGGWTRRDSEFRSWDEIWALESPTQVHIQNVERQNVERQNIDLQNVDKTKRRHDKPSTIRKRRQLQNVENLILAKRIRTELCEPGEWKYFWLSGKIETKI
jgi:hypothetical protein